MSEYITEFERPLPKGTVVVNANGDKRTIEKDSTNNSVVWFDGFLGPKYWPPGGTNYRVVSIPGQEQEIIIDDLKVKPLNVNDTLALRGQVYGEFRKHASISQALKNSMVCEDGWNRLSDSQREALDMIMHKVARIINGDPNSIDQWHDIAGYSTLIVKELEGNPV